MIIFVDVLKRFEKHENWKLKNVYGIESGCFQRSNPGDIRLFGLISFISTHFILVLFGCSVYLRRFHMLHSKFIMIAWDKIVCSVVDLFIIISVPFFLCTLWAHEFVLFEFICGLELHCILFSNCATLQHQHHCVHVCGLYMQACSYFVRTCLFRTIERWCMNEIIKCGGHRWKFICTS